MLLARKDGAYPLHFRWWVVEAGQGVGFDVSRARTIRQGKIKSIKQQRPMSLSRVEASGRAEVFEGTVKVGEPPKEENLMIYDVSKEVFHSNLEGC